MLRIAGWALVIPIAVVACGPRGSGASSAGRTQPTSDAATWPGDQPGPCRQTLTLAYEPRLADVLVLFDRSGSMSTAFGAGSRFSVEADLVGGVIAAYQDHIRFGFQQFPSPVACADDATGGCCAEPPLVPTEYGAGDAITYAIAGAGPPSGGTPTAAALRQARSYFAASPVANDAPARYLLLSTDGAPNCDAAGHVAGNALAAATEAACSEAIAEVTALRHDLGVRVLVLGVGSGLTGTPEQPSCLDRMALAGEAARTDWPPFFPASTPRQLERALQEIFGVVSPPVCSIPLTMKPVDPEQVSVWFDGHEVPRDRSGTAGWDWQDDSHGAVALRGPPCRAVELLQVKTIEIRAGCPPCTMPQLCE